MFVYVSILEGMEEVMNEVTDECSGDGSWDGFGYCSLDNPLYCSDEWPVDSVEDGPVDYSQEGVEDMRSQVPLIYEKVSSISAWVDRILFRVDSFASRVDSNSY